ncbi:hypothetical protein [Candidatus Erwinia haradaeae]|uniref:hypothetical protein n=1 Tax=Candidatus Erwinia haradaeae TaxID=1922217 RepID=UPI0009331AD4|nr:hypothetical protein [Candidatus Erwinia haradaeae]
MRLQARLFFAKYSGQRLCSQDLESDETHASGIFAYSGDDDSLLDGLTAKYSPVVYWIHLMQKILV